MAEEQEVLENEDEGVEVEVESPEEENTEAAAPVEESDSDDGELDSYSQKVQSRIKKLTEKYRKEERDREEAVRMAQQLLNENNQLKNRMQNLDKGYLAEYSTRLETQMAAAKKLYREAYDGGDTEKMLEAQEALSKMSIEQERLRLAKQRSERAPQQPQQQPAQQYQQQPQQQQPQPQPQKPDAKAEEWAGKNSWFGTDEAMTFAAFGIHKKLIEDEGFDPTSNDYYNELDSRIKREFPHKFEQDSSASRRPAQNVAGVSRSSSSGRNGKRVKLSPTQVAIAKKLGVPLEEYAKYVKE